MFSYPHLSTVACAKSPAEVQEVVGNLIMSLSCAQHEWCREQRARMDVDEPTAKAVGGEVLPMIFVVSKAIEYIKNQILDRVVSFP